MKNKIYIAVFILLWLITAVSSIWMATINKDLIEANENLYEDYQELHEEYNNVKLHRDTLIDQFWMESQKEMKEVD